MQHSNWRGANAACTCLLALLACFTLPNPAAAGLITYIAPSESRNSGATWSAVNGTYTQNYGIAFMTGSAGPFDIDWINFHLFTNSITSGTGSLTVALRNTNNTNAYSAVAGTTEYAKDTVSFLMPTTTSTFFDLNLTAQQLANISAYSLQPNTAYSLIAYAPSANFAIARTTGYAENTTNTKYDVTNGFIMLDTFRNNSPNYTNSANSYPSLQISFGADPGAAAVPEPGMFSALCFIGLGVWNRMRRRKA